MNGLKYIFCKDSGVRPSWSICLLRQKSHSKKVVWREARFMKEIAVNFHVSRGFFLVYLPMQHFWGGGRKAKKWMEEIPTTNQCQKTFSPSREEKNWATRKNATSMERNLGKNPLLHPILSFLGFSVSDLRKHLGTEVRSSISNLESGQSIHLRELNQAF